MDNKAKLVFRKEEGKLVASVPQMYKVMEKDTSHVGMKVATGKRRYSWTDAVVFKAPRVGSKKGGSTEWVAVEAVMQKLFEDAC